MLRCLLPPRGSRSSLFDLRYDQLGGVTRRVVILDESTAHFLHGCHGRLLGGCGQERAGSVLQLAGAFGGYNNKAIRTHLRIVRDRIHRVVPDSFCHFVSIPHRLSKLSKIGLTSCSTRWRRTRSARTTDCRLAEATSRSLLIST